MTDLPIDEEVLEDWLGGPVPEEKRLEIRQQSKDVAAYIQETNAFYDWFDEIEGFHIREERFWDDVQSGDTKQLLEWLRTAFRVGFEAGRSYRD